MPESPPTPPESPPTPPTTLADDDQQALQEVLDGCPPGELERVADYVEQLAAYRGAGSPEEAIDVDSGNDSGSDGACDSDDTRGSDDARSSEADEVPDDAPEEIPDEIPDDVPAKATRTVKTINDNRYYYWQWREGDAIKSKYIGPAGDDA